MAQLNITLNQEEIQALLLEDQGEAFKKILLSSLNKFLQVESAEQLKAAPLRCLIRNFNYINKLA